MNLSVEGVTTIISLYCTQLACLFPQHGAGRKHDRRIELEEWQRCDRRAAAVAISAWTSPVGRLGVRQPLGSGRVRLVRLHEPFGRHHGALRRCIRPGRSRVPGEHPSASESAAARALRRCWSALASRFECALRLTGHAAVVERYTRRPQEAVGLCPWRFESSQPHSEAPLRRAFLPTTGRASAASRTRSPRTRRSLRSRACRPGSGGACAARASAFRGTRSAAVVVHMVAGHVAHEVAEWYPAASTFARASGARAPFGRGGSNPLGRTRGCPSARRAEARPPSR
jgi:hypothetical protein